MFFFVQKDFGCMCMCYVLICDIQDALSSISSTSFKSSTFLPRNTIDLSSSGLCCSHVILPEILKAFLVSILIIVTLTVTQIYSNLCVCVCTFLICLYLKIAWFIIGFFYYLLIYYGVIIITININFSLKCKLHGGRDFDSYTKEFRIEQAFNSSEWGLK